MESEQQSEQLSYFTFETRRFDPISKREFTLRAAWPDSEYWRLRAVELLGARVLEGGLSYYNAIASLSA